MPSKPVRAKKKTLVGSAPVAAPQAITPDFELEAPRASRRLPVLGLVLTILWLAVVVIFVGFNWNAFSDLAPNLAGDFAAGVFAPLAFLWLVLGFFQQGEELRHSGKALWLQGRELQHSVEQQRELVKVTREQLQFESSMLEQQRTELIRNSQPILKLSQAGSYAPSGNQRLYTFRLINIGKTCTDLSVQAEGGPGPWVAGLLQPGKHFDVNMELPVSGDIAAFNLTATYLDERLMQGSKTFAVERSEGTFIITET